MFVVLLIFSGRLKMFLMVHSTSESLAFPCFHLTVPMVPTYVFHSWFFNIKKLSFLFHVSKIEKNKYFLWVLEYYCYNYGKELRCPYVSLCGMTIWYQFPFHFKCVILELFMFHPELRESRQSAVNQFRMQLPHTKRSDSWFHVNTAFEILFHF